jgi:hypothetical protein
VLFGGLAAPGEPLPLEPKTMAPFWTLTSSTCGWDEPDRRSELTSGGGPPAAGGSPAPTGASAGREPAESAARWLAAGGSTAISNVPWSMTVPPSATGAGGGGPAVPSWTGVGPGGDEEAGGPRSGPIAGLPCPGVCPCGSRFAVPIRIAGSPAIAPGVEAGGAETEGLVASATKAQAQRSKAPRRAVVRLNCANSVAKRVLPGSTRTHPILGITRHANSESCMRASAFG